MLIAALFAALLSLAFSSRIFDNKCSKELEGIVYAPNNYYKDYLVGISRELKNLATFYNTPTGRDFVTKFSVKYRVIVAVFDAMGRSTFFEDGVVVDQSINQRGGKYSSHDAGAVMNLGSYANTETVYVYSFMSFSKDGVVYQVTIARPKQYPPDF